MPPQLVALTEGPDLLLDKPILLIGRHQECDIQIPSRKISRRHCCVAQVEDHLVVRDLCSTNGIRINGMRVQEGCLRSGDELTIGSFRYQVKFPSRQVSLERKLPPASAKDGKGPFDSCDEPVPLSDDQASVPIAEPPSASLQATLNKQEANGVHSEPGASPRPDHLPFPEAPALQDSSEKPPSGH